MKNKDKIVENKGITGMGTDYNVYILSGTKRVTVLMAGFMIGFIASYIYFDNQNILKPKQIRNMRKQLL